MFNSPRLPVAAIVVALSAATAAIDVHGADAPGTGPNAVNVTVTGPQTRVSVPSTTSSIHVTGVSGIWCAVDSPNFQAMLTSEVAARGGDVNALLSGVGAATSRKAKLDLLFKCQPGDKVCARLSDVLVSTTSPHVALSSAQRDQLRTGQPVQLELEQTLGVRACYTTAQIDAVIAEAVRVLQMAAK